MIKQTDISHRTHNKSKKTKQQIDRELETHIESPELSGEPDLETANGLRHILDSLPALVAYVDSDHRYCFVNRAYERLMGKAAADIIGKRMKDILGFSRYRKIRSKVERALGGAEVSFEQGMEFEPGNEQWYLFRFVPNKVGRTVRGFFVLALDISTRKENEQRVGALNRELSEVKLELKSRLEARLAELMTVNAQLRKEIAMHKQTTETLNQSEARYRAIVDNQPALVFRYSVQNFELTFVNRASCRYFGKTEAQLIGLSLFSLLPKNAHERVRQHIAEVIKNKQSTTHEHQIVMGNGQVVWREWTDQPILDQWGQVAEIQAMGYDIEERQRVAKVIQSPRQGKHYREGALPEYVEDLPNICGAEQMVEAQIRSRQHEILYLNQNDIDFTKVRSASAIALHMHQPLIPAGGKDLQRASMISNLQSMMESQDSGDNHNAEIFHRCYKRIGSYIPQLIDEGQQPRIMLDYSGVLLHGLRQMGLDDVIESLNRITNDLRYRHAVEWLGSTWGHAVAPSTPTQDFRLHVKAWQQHFAATFGLEALSRVRGFSPAEMALPNHPDVAYEFVKTLKECGYQWVFVQEHTVELPESGHSPERPYIPHLLRCTNAKGESATIIAIIKTQGSDTKLVAQMQPYYVAKGLTKESLAGKSIIPLVSQIADGENGGVMMNEFPPKYFEVVREASQSATPLMNVSEYLEHLFSSGIQEDDLPIVQPIKQKQIWARFSPGDGSDRLTEVIRTLHEEDEHFHMEGGSWTNNVSWVAQYEDLLNPIQKASALFHEKVKSGEVRTDEYRYRNALFYLLTAQTSCYRYWGQGTWTDYGREICRRLDDILKYDF